MTTLAAYLHTLDPFVFRLSGDFGIRWYGLSYIAGFALGYLLMLALAKRRLIEIPRERLADAMLVLIIGTLLGGRLVYVLVYDQSLLEFHKGFPFWGVFAINRGGMASHGGMLGVILASWRISRGWRAADGTIVGRTSWLHVLDVTALCCPLGLLFGRLANFINAELLGRIYSPAGVEGPWWTVQFPKELLTEKTSLTAEQEAALRTLVADATGKPLDYGLPEVVEHAARYADRLKPLLTSRYPSQLFQGAAEGLVLGGVLWLIWARPRKPGVIGSWFMILYGVLRIVTEWWRIPDAQFFSEHAKNGRPYGLSMGQWLSVAMVGVGLTFLIVIMQRPAAKVGGWWRPANRPAAA